VDRLPSLVRSLVVTDAPTAMLWWGPPPLPASRELLREIDRLIVDTRKLPGEAGLADYLRVAEDQPELEVADCAWLGVRPLRGLTAGMFDPPNDPRRLDALDRVRVTSGVTGCQSRALLTLGWLSSRLGWKEEQKLPEQPGLRSWRVRRRDGGQARVELETRTGGAKHGVIALELQTGDERWNLERSAGVVTVHGSHCTRRLQPMRQHTDAELVISALGPRGRDPMFKDALRGAVALVGA
jgi:glucose-6-phosphate dehydrogenase assembly protein OpcA